VKVDFRRALRPSQSAETTTVPSGLQATAAVERPTATEYKTGERRLDVVEFIEVAEARGVDARRLIADMITVNPS
jgi:hypothetical protein